MSYPGEQKRDSRAAVVLIVVAAALIAVMLWMNGPTGPGEAAKFPVRPATQPGDGPYQDANGNGGR